MTSAPTPSTAPVSATATEAGPTTAPESPSQTTPPEAEPTAQPTPPTAKALIEADLAAGTIDEPTSLLYRIEAMFGAPELPQKYQAGVPEEDGAAIATAQQELDQMPADVRAQIEPFLVRPTDPTSVFHGGGGSPPASPASPSSSAISHGRLRAAGAAAEPVCGPDGWASIANEELNITVWGLCGNGRSTDDLVAAMNALAAVVPDEIQLMGDPIPDDGTADEGGDSNIDVYLIEQCLTRGGICRDVGTQEAGVEYPSSPFVGSPGAQASSGFVMIDRSWTSLTDIDSILAHEFFHVLEDAHNETGLLAGGNYHWMTEASAKWAEEFFVPSGRVGWVYPWLKDYESTTASLEGTAGGNAYMSFVWPYWMEQEASPDTVGAAWSAFDGLSGWNALNAALDGVFSFADNYRQFAVTAFNTTLPGGNGSQDPIDPRWQAQDGQLPKTGPTNPEKRSLAPEIAGAPAPGNKVDVPEDFPPLSERYRILDVPDNVQKLVLDFSGLQPSSALDATALIHLKSGNWIKQDLSTGSNDLCRTDYDLDKVLLVLDSHGYTDDAEVTGHWTIRAISDPCQPTSWKVDAEDQPGSNLPHPGAGAYSGNGDVECSFITGGPLPAPGATFKPNVPGKWHASFLVSKPVNDIYEVTIDGGEPGSGATAYVRAITDKDVDTRDFQVQQGFEGGSVQVNVQDHGGNDVTVSAQGADDFVKIDATLTCSTVVRG